MDPQRTFFVAAVSSPCLNTSQRTSPRMWIFLSSAEMQNSHPKPMPRYAPHMTLGSLSTHSPRCSVNLPATETMSLWQDPTESRPPPRSSLTYSVIPALMRATSSARNPYHFPYRLAWALIRHSCLKVMSTLLRTTTRVRNSCIFIRATSYSRRSYMTT